jgi:hypothetical protein
MKWKLGVCALVVTATVGALIAGEGVKSGPQCGGELGAFNVTKIAGPDDGVKVGQTLCYRCMYGKRPVVMIFSQKTDDALASLVKKLDPVVAQNSEKKMKSFVTFLGTDAGALQGKVEEFAESTKVKQIPLTVSVEPDGPESYGLNKEAAYTVLIYKDPVVEGVLVNHALKEGELTKEKIDEIVKDTAKILE